jgi:hypothetical protein
VRRRDRRDGALGALVYRIAASRARHATAVSGRSAAFRAMALASFDVAEANPREARPREAHRGTSAARPAPGQLVLRRKREPVSISPLFNRAVHRDGFIR